jgi:hypothetical protein
VQRSLILKRAPTGSARARRDGESQCCCFLDRAHRDGEAPRLERNASFVKTRSAEEDRFARCRRSCG